MPEESGQVARRRRRTGLLVGILLPAAASYALMLLLTQVADPAYGVTLFLWLPFFIGLTAVLLAGFWTDLTLGQSLQVAGASLGVSLTSAFLLGAEGLICLALSLPIALAGGLAGGGLAYASRKSRGGPRNLVVLLPVTGLVAYDVLVQKEPVRFVVETVEYVNATPAEAWQVIVGLNRVERPAGFLANYLACPVQVRLDGTGVGAIRTCTLSTGDMIEEVTRWEPGAVLAWTTHTTPPPMIEINPLHDVQPPHLNGYVITTGGEFAIEPTRDGCLVVRRTEIEMKIYPGFYWGFWVKKGTDMAHNSVLQHVKDVAERKALR